MFGELALGLGFMFGSVLVSWLFGLWVFHGSRLR